MTKDKASQSGERSAEIDKTLFNKPLSQPEADAVREIYLAYLQYADTVSDRRMRTNSFFLTLHTGLFIFLGYVFSKDAAQELGSLKWVIPGLGAIIGLFWHRLIASYRQLMTSKFEIIHRIEMHLPLAPYKAEWIALAKGEDSATYKPLTHIEVWIPLLFVGAHVLILLLWLPWGHCAC